MVEGIIRMVEGIVRMVEEIIWMDEGIILAEGPPPVGPFHGLFELTRHGALCGPRSGARQSRPLDQLAIHLQHSVPFTTPPPHPRKPHPNRLELKKTRVFTDED